MQKALYTFSLMWIQARFIATVIKGKAKVPNECQVRLFCYPFPVKKNQTRLIESETFFHYRKLTSIRSSCLNKTILTHFDNGYVWMSCFFLAQNRKLLIFLSRLRDFIGKNSVNKDCLSILNCHPENTFSFLIQVFLL